MGNADLRTARSSELPDAILRIVVLICADYARRAELIENRGIGRRTELEYRYLNHKTYEAAAEIIGENDAMTVINEIGERTGYAKSRLYYMSERLYKNLKSEVIFNIARRLNLVD